MAPLAKNSPNFFISFSKDISGGLGENLLDIKRRILDWVGRCTTNYPDVEVRNFTDSFNDGKVRKVVEQRYFLSSSHI